ncbi:MAG: Stk1 family PASTA domain-containing Ser/Thr kinase [Oscillospiraceae bacterium]|nr:Stk1 family PASTA domain-containing Ser/Thr kinase [Oscillospiraceae bacterium]
MDRFINKKLDGRYEITELIGIGGMANVYKATDVTDKSQVAVKILKEEFMTSDELVRSFRNESKAIALLDHPNIVKVKDVNFGDRIQYIVMEHIEGITLKECIERKGKLGWKETVHFVSQVLHALKHAHEKGIVHRDIKPQNIMLLQNGQIKVMDFGIARFSRDAAKTIADKAIGSVHYISPEQARGAISDQKSDIYSVGVMLFEMLTGKLPFESENLVSVAIMQMQKQATPPRQINPDIPEALESIVIKAMQKDPDNRYQSASQMLEDLERFKNNPSIVFAYKYLDKQQSGGTKYFDAVKQPVKKVEEDMPAKRSSKKSKKKPSSLMVLAGVAAAFVIVTMIAVFSMLGLGGFFTSVDNIPMGNYIGQDYEKAVKMAKKDGIILEASQYEYTPDVEKDLIFWQQKDEGEIIKENTVVKVKVSLGIKEEAVPSVEGSTFEDAEALLTKKGFVVVKKMEFSDDVLQNYVITTNPKARVSVPVGSEVIVTVSAGVEVKPTVVPNVLGKDIEAALVALEQAKLKVTKEAVDSSKPKGEVLTQSLPADSEVDENSEIKLTYSIGPKEEPKPVEKSVTLSVKLPREASGVHSFSLLDGNGIQINGVDNVDVAANVSKRLDFKVSGTGVQYFTVKVDSKKYISYEVDFDKGAVAEYSEYKYDLLIDESAQ